MKPASNTDTNSLLDVFLAGCGDGKRLGPVSMDDPLLSPQGFLTLREMFDRCLLDLRQVPAAALPPYDPRDEGTLVFVAQVSGTRKGWQINESDYRCLCRKAKRPAHLMKGFFL